MGWVIIASLVFIFDRLGSDIVILILSIGGVGTRVFNISTLVLRSFLHIALINY